MQSKYDLKTLIGFSVDGVKESALQSKYVGFTADDSCWLACRLMKRFEFQSETIIRSETARDYEAGTPFLMANG